MREIFENLFLLLEPKLQNSSYFQELEKIIFSYLSEDFELFQVSSEIAECLEEAGMYVDASTEFDVKYVSDLLSLTIDELNGQPFVDLRVKNNHMITSTLFNLSEWLSRIETIQIPLQDGVYSDFLCDIYYYHDTVPLDFQVNGEKDMVFSKEFGVPLRLSRYFRLHFSKLAPVILNYQETNEFDSFESYLSLDDFYSFLKPFSLSQLSHFINAQFEDEMQGNLSDIVKENEGLSPICTFELDSIIEQLISTIGSDGEVVMSHNLYQSFVLYLMGYSSSVSTNGFILKKVNNLYTLYYVSIDDERVIVVPKDLTFYEAKDIYYRNALNQEIEGLSEFFGIGRERKPKN